MEHKYQKMKEKIKDGSVMYGQKYKPREQVIDTNKANKRPENQSKLTHTILNITEVAQSMFLTCIRDIITVKI